MTQIGLFMNSAPRDLIELTFFSAVGFTATTGLPVIAGGCSSHMNKKAEIKCAEDDTECQTEKAEKFDLRDSLKS